MDGRTTSVARWACVAALWSVLALALWTGPAAHAGGYADNYINFHCSGVAGLDNLMISALTPEPGTFCLLALGGLGLLRRRRAGRRGAALLLALLALGLLLPASPAEANIIRYLRITGDADSDISLAKTYTHKLDFGTSPVATVNGVAFTQGLVASLPSNFSYAIISGTGTPTSHGGNANHNVTGGMVSLMTDMIYPNGSAGAVCRATLSGLVVGRYYDTRVYTRAWDAVAGTRTSNITFDPDGGGPVARTITLSQDNASLAPPAMDTFNRAYAISYRFQAMQPTMTIDFQQATTASWHLYGVSNEVARPFVPSFYSTGLDASFNPVADGSPDPHWTVTPPTGPTVQATSQLPHPAWVGAGGGEDGASGWISTVANGTTNVAPGTYLYATTFSLHNYDEKSAILNLRLSVDDALSAVRLNGVVIPGITSGGWALGPTLFTISSGFKPGFNTLEFVTVNGGASDNPHGFRTELFLTAYTPEPGTLGLLALGAVGLLRRRRRAARRGAAALLALLALGFLLPASPAEANVVRYVRITGDGDCDISLAKTYTHKLDFGTSPVATVNGVAFTQGLVGSLPPNFSFAVISGTGTPTNNAGNANTGVPAGDGIHNLLYDMIYTGSNSAGAITRATLSGLVVGQHYDTRIYTRQWGASASRLVNITFDPDGGGPVTRTVGTLSEDDATQAPPVLDAGNRAYAISYRFLATQPTMTIDLEQLNFNNSWHLYGLTNERMPRPFVSSLYSPGLDANHLPLADGSVDPHYTLLASPYGIVPVLAQNPHPAWLQEDGITGWISTDASGSANLLPGTYSYRTTFSLHNYDEKSAVLTMRFVVDNNVTDVLLNGVSTGIAYGGFGGWSSMFTLSSGFKPGFNTLDFVTLNGAGGDNPYGFRAELFLTAYTPEPGTLSLLALGGLGLLRRRRSR